MTAIPTYKVHSDLSLMMDKFIVCITEQRLEVLIIEGEPPAEVLAEAWNSIYSLYLDAMDDAETFYVLQLQMDIARLNYKILCVEKLTEALSTVVYTKSLVRLLGSFGIDTQNIKPGPGLKQELARVTACLAPWRLQLSEKLKELEDFDSITTTDGVKKSSFTELLIRLSRFQRYKMKPDETSVEEFVATFKEYVRYHKLKSPTENHGEEN